MFSRVASVLALAVILGGCNYKYVPEPALSPRDQQFMALAPQFELLDPNYERYGKIK